MKIDSRTRFVNKHKMVPGAIELEQGLILSNNKEFEPYRCANLYNPNFCFLPEGDVSICMGAINKNGTIGRYKPEVEIDYKKLDIIKARRIDRNEKCQVCSYKVFCRGGCLATALSRTSNCLEHVCDLWNTPDFIKYLELAF